MAEQVRVVVDAMGGDNAPAEPVKAAVEAVTERQDIKVILTGKQEVIDKELAKYSGYPKNQIQVVNASQVIETAEPPVFAIRKKKDSSIVVGLNMVKKQETASCTVDPYHKGSFPSDRLRCQCGCTSITSGTVCEDGFYLYGECSRH